MEDVPTMLAAAQAYLIENRFEEAIAEFDKSLEADPMNVEAYLGLAEAYEKMGDKEKAIETLEKGFEVTGDDRIKAALELLLNGDSAGNDITEAVTSATTAETTETTTEITTTTVTTTEATTTTAPKEEFITIKGEQYSTLLTELDLRSMDLTNEDIQPLSKMTNLEILVLYSNEISDISPLSRLTNLTWLYLSENQISDISPLSGLTNLTDLILENNKINDVKALSGLINLTKLDIFCNEISDISALSGLTNLTHLNLSENQISDADIEALKKALPNCEIY